MATVLSLDVARAERGQRSLGERRRKLALELAEMTIIVLSRGPEAGAAAAAGLDGTALLETMREAVAVLAERR